MLTTSLNSTSFSPKIQLAHQLAKMFHKGQIYGDASTDYYSYHICGVLQLIQVHDLPEEYQISTILHDIVEDTTVTLDTIRNLFGDEVGDAVDALTKRPGEHVDSYMVRCNSNEIARIVKLHDSMFNAVNCAKNKNKIKYNTYLKKLSSLTM